MTTAAQVGSASRNGAPDQKSSKLSKVPDRDYAIAAEVRAELARQLNKGRSQREIALELFGEQQAWLNRRLLGQVAFSPAELLVMADWLDVDVVKFLAAGKGPRPTFDGDLRVTGNDTDGTRPTFPCLSDGNVTLGPWVTQGGSSAPSDVHAA